MVRYLRKSRALAAASVLVATAALTGQAFAAAACKPGGLLQMARDQDATALVPTESDGNGNIFLQEQMYDHLVEQMPGQADLQPGLAESWTISPDGLTYTFKLRAAKFSNGDPVTADDVKFSLDRMIDPKVQVGWSFLMPNIKSFEVADASTVVMHMKQVDASVLFTLSLPAGGVISKKAFETMGAEAFAANPVGSGAFMLKSWTRGQELELVKNPNYWREGQPVLDGVKFQIVEDDNARILKIQAGETDIAQSIPFSQAKQVGQFDGVNVLVEPYVVGFGVWLNNTAKPLDEKVVRQALNYATPKDIINEVVLSGLGTIQNSIIPPTHYWDSTVPAYPYDLDKAKALMAQSSVPNGFTLPIMVFGGDTQSQQTAEILQNEWAKIGVKVEIETGDRPALAARYWAGDYMARLVPPSGLSSDTPDDSEWAGLVFDSTTPYKGAVGFGTRYASEKATQLVKAAQGTIDDAKRRELYGELQRFGMEEAPQVPMLFSPTVTAVRKNVANFSTLSTGWWRLEQTCFTE